MKFFLFSNISFEIPDPIALIECYCYQNDFYSKYDLLKDKKIEDVNKIGARMKKEVLLESKKITERTNNLGNDKTKLHLEHLKSIDITVYLEHENMPSLRQYKIMATFHWSD